MKKKISTKVTHFGQGKEGGSIVSSQKNSIRDEKDSVVEQENEKLFSKRSPSQIIDEAVKDQESLVRQHQGSLNNRISTIKSDIDNDTMSVEQNEGEDNDSGENTKRNQKKDRSKQIKKRDSKLNINKFRQQYQIDDFTITNSVGRNILHRSCLKQNAQMVEDLLKQFEELKHQQEVHYKLYQKYYTMQNEADAGTVQEKIKDYVNKLDKFGNSPLILLFVQESTEGCYRKKCLQVLLAAGANINHRNPRTLWSALHWCSHQGDIESASVLLSYSIPKQYFMFLKAEIKISAHICFPDQEGFFPMDLAGIKGHKEITLKLIENLVREIKEIESNIALKEKEDQINSTEYLFYTKETDEEFMIRFRKKYLFSPLLKSRMLYWAAQYSSETQLEMIQEIFNFSQTFIMVKQPHQNQMTSLHVAAAHKNAEVLEFLAVNIIFKNHIAKTDWMESMYKERVAIKYSFNLFNNSILPLIAGEKDIYKESFWEEIKDVAIWQNQFILDYRKTKQLSKNLYIDQQDMFGNTALHLASINGFESGVKILMSFGSDMEIDNKECWRPRELVQHENIRQFYQEALEENQGLNNQLRGMNKQLELLIRENNEVDDSVDFNHNQREKELYSLGTKLFLPDFVIVFSLGTSELAENVLRKSGFNVYLLESVFPDKYYLLIGMPEEELQRACHQNKMQMKLVDSYDYEPFNMYKKTRFEPFRSKQRQDIIEMQLNKIINLQDLKSQKLISSYYKMHTYGGIARIKFQWVDETNWFWPQPLNQVDDYLLEEKDQNFTSVTLLRQYFGEQIAFFFGWKSFITCFQILIAVPGLAFQIYIIQQGTTDYNNILVSFWVVYVMIWSTIIVEYWKRKTSEINYRWGTMDEMNNPDILNKQLRDDFIGDECISEVTGVLTKFQGKTKILIKLLITIPVLLGLMFLVVYIFLVVDNFKNSFTNKNSNSLTNNLYKTLAGVLQGIGIQVLNFLYTFFARKFTQMENHKYVYQYDRSIIYKLMAFKVLNSYFALFYVAFLQEDSTFSTLFFMLLPIVLVKQINYTIFNVWTPMYFFKRAERQYFSKVQTRIIEHQLQQGQNDALKEQNQDVIEKFWNDYSKEDMLNLHRAIISLGDGSSEKTNAIKLVKTMDADSIELNSLRGEYIDTINYYADGFIDLGYVTLFAAAFPIGPLICLVMNSLEIRNKLNGFMYILKRPTCQRCAGIGEWLFIWEGFSYVSVISNIGLLYEKDSLLMDLFIVEENYSTEELKTYKTWIYICLGIIIVFLKYVFQVVIQDKPEWIRKEEEKWSYEDQIKKEQNEKILQVAIKSKEESQKKRIQEIERMNKKCEKEIADREEKIMTLKYESQRYQSYCPPEFKDYSKLSGAQKEELITNASIQRSFKAKTEFQMKVFGILRTTYIKIERELLIQRMRQLECMNFGTICLCNECGKDLSTINCSDCDQMFCEQCFDDYHSFLKQDGHKVDILNKRSLLNDFPSEKYVMYSEEQEKKDSQLITESSEASNKKQDSKISAKNYQKLMNCWRKFECFILPTYKKSPQHFLLENMFSYMKKEFIENNGIDESKEDFDTKKLFRLQEVENSKGKFVIVEEKELSQIVNFQEFNTEDKLFLNRIAFLSFKRHGPSTQFTHFFQYCKILQDGYPEQKFLLLLDFIDEDDSQMIERDEVKKIFYSSFLQASSQETKIDSIIDNLFGDLRSMSKLEIGKKFLNSYEKDPLLFGFLVSLLQDKRTPL